jgi:thioredoxin 1
MIRGEPVDKPSMPYYCYFIFFVEETGVHDRGAASIPDPIRPRLPGDKGKTNERTIPMAEGILEISDSSFDAEVLKAETPVLVDFWAPWCGPCRAIAPVIEELVTTYGEQVKFAKCNVDDNPVTPGKYGIRAIPTLILFKGGEVADQITGIVAKSKLEDAIKGVL